MRGGDNRTGELFSYVDLGARVRRDHPLRAIRTSVNEALSTLEREFAAPYSPIGRPSISPEADAGDAVAGVLFDSLGAASDGVVKAKLLHRARADGEPPRHAGRRLPDAG